MCGNDVVLSRASCLQVCTVRKKDIRKFLDGAYVEEKGFITPPPEE